MEDSDTNDYVHNKRSRTISNLSQQQLQHKRDLDRKAQRALRQRTKSRIQELSDDIARLKASSSERETAMIDELQALREQNRQLKMRLEHISRLAANHDSSENGTEICTNEDSNEKEVEGGGLITSSRGNRPSEEDDGQPSSDFDATVEDVDNGTYVHKPGDVNLQVPQYPQEADQSHFHDIGSSPYKEVMSTSYAPASHMELVYAVVEENGESRNSVGTAPSECVENTSIQQIGKDQYLDGPRPITGNEPQTSAISPESSTTTHTAYFSDCSSSARGVSSFLPRHLPATCPLDQILLDFLSSRRMLVAQGTHIETLLGPEQPSVAAMLNPELAPTAHPLSRVMAEVLSIFEGVRLQELISFMYLMHRTMRWQISPTKANYMRLPQWLQPTTSQIMIPHPAWIDNIPWPRVRDLLIEDPNKYSFEKFSEAYSQTVTVNWPFEPMDAVVRIGAGSPGEVILNPLFEKHIQKLSNWTVSREFELRFPEAAAAIQSRD